jgi:CRP/FNR family transcriptional regulator, nitrogen oxide reductase regulator
LLQQSNHLGFHDTAKPEPASTRLVKGELFAGLDDAALAQMRYAAQVRRIGPKRNVTVTGEPGANVYLLQAGRARSYILTESGVEVLLLWVVPGDVIGLVSLLANPPAYMANTETVTECEFLVWDHATIRRLAQAYPRVMENGFRLALHHLAAYMKRHTSILTKSAESRLAQALRKLATKAGEVQSSGVVINITNEQLSSLSDVSYFTASRLLSKWAHHGMLAKQRGRITLLAPEGLMVA